MILQEINFGAIVGYLVGIFVAIWIYNDAKERGMDPTIYILLTCLCSWCCGGVVYLIARSEHEPTRTSYSSSTSQPSSSEPTFQSSSENYYGQPQDRSSYQDASQPSYQQSYQPSDSYTYRPETPQKDAGTKTCNNCGTDVPSDVKFCPMCGSNAFH